MKLYIKQKVFSWGDKFNIKDEFGNDKYYVEGEIFSFGKKLHIYNSLNQEVAFIEQELFTLLPRYNVYINDKKMFEIQKEFSFFFPKYNIEGLGLEVEGDVFSHDYEIHKNNEVIATISKEWMTWGDSYELDINDEVDTIVALTIVLTIDCVLANSSS